MMKDAISKTRLILEDAQQKLPVEAAVAIEQVYGDIEHLNNFIKAETQAIEADEVLNEEAKSTARRKVLEQAGRKLEVLKQKRIYSDLIKKLEAKITDAPVDEDQSLLKFMREREVRDRLVGMTKSQILSHFRDSLFDGSNLLLIDAILNTPPGFDLLPQDILNKLRVVRAKRINPEMASEIEIVRKLNATILQMLSLVKNELDSLRKKELLR
ncbi:MAG: hypothetical protein JSV31_24570 [Desulfobacterales bacterium]|nr:MAG: hypothetical protein JSV31_24570 [Desulfobacterales bacterium]